MMPKRSDQYLSLFQGRNEPIKDNLKQTMVTQENMFRNQVQELHRAYQMQMFMMKNSRSKEMAETQYLNYSQADYLVGNWSQRPPNSQLPAAFYASYRNDHFVPKGNGWGTQEKPIDVECYFPGDTETSTGNLNLSLNVGGHVTCSNGKKSLEEKVTPASSPQILDLEESTGIVFNNEYVLKSRRAPASFPRMIDLEESTSIAFNNEHGLKSGHVLCAPASFPRMIDLEESTSLVFNNEHRSKPEFISAGCSSHFGEKTRLPFFSSFTNNTNKGISSSSTKRSLSFLDVITNRRERSSLNQDYEKQQYEVPPAMEVSVGKTSLLDLNEPPCDEMSFHDTVVHSLVSSSTVGLNGSARVFQESMSPDSSSSIKPNDNCSTLLLHQHTPTSILTPFNSSSSRDNSTNGGSSNASLIDLESCGRPKSENSEEHECLTSTNSQQKEGELGSKLEAVHSKAEEGLMSSLCRKEDCIEMPYKPMSENSEDHECLTSTNSQLKEGELGSKLEAINSKAEEGLMSSLCRKEDSIEMPDIDMSPVSSKPDDNGADPVQSSESSQVDSLAEKTDIDMSPISSKPDDNGADPVQSSESSQANSLGNENEGLEDSIEKADIDMSPISSKPDDNEVDPVQSSESSEGLAEDDTIVRRGAMSLLYFIAADSPTGQNHYFGKANNSGHGIEKDQPERSLDSFESAMLKLKASEVDDYNDVSSNRCEAKDIVEKDSPVKLRRGRRMKDFQKDILPSMTTLSRHEIFEDVRLMEGVIRSREYKRLKSKTSGEHNWFTPVKSRRSRLNNNIGRKTYN